MVQLTFLETMFYVMNVCLQHVWNTTLVSVILKDISVPLLATLLCGVCNWSTMFCVYGNPNNCRLQHERTYRTPTLIKLQIMCCEMSNFIAQHTAIYCCIVVLITFVLCTVLFIFYAVQANQFCCMLCFYCYQNTLSLTLQFT